MCREGELRPARPVHDDDSEDVLPVSSKVKAALAGAAPEVLA